MLKARKANPLQSVDHAMKLLEAVAEHREIGVSDLAVILGRSTSGAFRILTTLQANGWVEQNPTTRKYHLGLKMFEITARHVRQLDVRESARDYLVELMRVSGETARLDILDRLESITIDAVESPAPIQLRFGVGHRSALHATSTGKVQLAYAPEELIEQVFAHGLTAHTPHTITDPDRLRTELALIRRRGYAINVSGWRDGAAGMAAPIRNAQGIVVAAVGIGGPISRLTAKRREELVPHVMRAGREISQRLGWVDPLKVNGTHVQTATAAAPRRRMRAAQVVT